MADERLKMIRDLESDKREFEQSMNSLLEKLGEGVLTRALSRGADLPLDAAGEFKRIKGDIDTALAQISGLEADTARLKDLDGLLEEKQKAVSGIKGELDVFYAQAGECLFVEAGFEEAVAVFRSDYDNLRGKIDELDQKLQGLEEKNGRNLFSWIGKNASTLLTRTNLERLQAGLKKIYRDAGEAFAGQAASGGVEAASDALREAMLKIGEVKERVTSLRAVLGRSLSYGEAVSAFTAGFCEALDIEGRSAADTPSEREERRAAELALEKFSTRDWLHRREGSAGTGKE